MKKASEIWDTPEATGFDRVNTKDIEEIVEEVTEWKKGRLALAVHIRDILTTLTQHHEAEVQGELLEQVCVVLDGMKQFIPPFVSDSPDSMTLQEVVMRTAYNQALDDAKTTINNLLNDNQ